MGSWILRFERMTPRLESDSSSSGGSFVPWQPWRDLVVRPENPRRITKTLKEDLNLLRKYNISEETADMLIQFEPHDVFRRVLRSLPVPLEVRQSLKDMRRRSKNTVSAKACRERRVERLISLEEQLYESKERGKQQQLQLAKYNLELGELIKSFLDTFTKDGVVDHSVAHCEEVRVIFGAIHNFTQ